jgi:hypothetical protein
MASNTPITRQSMGRTFSVAAWTLGVFGALQFSAVGVAFIKSMSEDSGGRKAPASIDIERLLAESPPPQEEELSTQNPLDETPENEFPARPKPLLVGASAQAPDTEPPAPEPSKSDTPPRPTPVPLSVFTEKIDPQMNELVEQGKLLRNTGDTAGALGKFREAVTLAPKNPMPIAEMAYTYEKMTLNDKAAAEWRKILQMGEKAGAYYSAAKSKLDVAMSAAKSAHPGSTEVSGDVGTTNEVAFPNGKSLTLGRLTSVDDKDTTGKRFTLSIPIYAKDGAVKNPRQEVVTHVRFYDQLRTKEIVATTANVAYRFSEPPADWTDGGLETLDVDYDLAQIGKADPIGEGRNYYGYFVRVYFKGVLQATAAEPANLAQKFPASEKTLK